MRVLIRLIIGLVVLCSLTFMSLVFGIGGFLFTAGLLLVIFFAIV